MKMSFYLVLTFFAFSYAAYSASKFTKTKTPILKLETVRELRLPQDPITKAPGFISAASGLIKVQNRYYLVSDNASSLFSFTEGESTLSSYKLMEIVYSDNDKKKIEKADFESLTHLTVEQWPPYGAIVTWPSASNTKRMKAVTVPFTADGKLDKPIVSDISPLAHRLLPHAKDLNMEGLLVMGKKVHIFQRGNYKDSKNGIAEIPFPDFIQGLKTGEWTGKIGFESVKLGSLGGVKLGFSDAVYTPYGLLVLATAEDTSASVGDGQIMGTVLARVIGKKSEILGKFEPRNKLEGISIQETTDGLEVFVVEDADSTEKPSQLFKTRIPKEQLEAIKSR